MSRLRQTVVGMLVRVMGRHEDAGPTGLRLRAWMMRNVPGQITCAEFEQFVHDYQEGSLSARERRVFDLHMELCPMCRAYVTSYQQAIELGRRVCAAEDSSTPAEVPEELAAAILSARRAR